MKQKKYELSFKNNTNVFVVKQNRLNQAILSFQKLRKKLFWRNIFGECNNKMEKRAKIF